MMTPEEILFNRFWEVYPRKVAKGRARRWFAQHKPSDEFVGIMIKAVKAQSWDDPTYIPYPATWLNDERWTDEICDFKPKLPTIKGKICGECPMPAVYKSTGGAYDNYYCPEHMPPKIKLKYG